MLLEKLKQIERKFDQGIPPLLIEVALVLTVLDVEDYSGVEAINAIRNSSIDNDNSFRNSLYYQEFKNIINLMERNRIVYSPSIKGTTLASQPKYARVPTRDKDRILEFQVIPRIDYMLTGDRRIKETMDRLSRELQADLNPLEVLHKSPLEDEEIRDIINAALEIPSKEVVTRCNSQDEFFELFGTSDGFVIKGSYIVTVHEQEDIEIYTINENIRTKEEEVSVLDIMFY